MKRPLTRMGVAVAATTMLLAACAAPEKSNDAAGSDNTGADSGTSSEEYLATLQADAEKEGTLNVIALPPTWANYGNIIKAFEAKYDIDVVSKLPDTDSQTEIDTAKRLKGQKNAPDVFDVSQAVALANTDMFAPYKVQTWDDIPADNKDENGLWVNDYGGYFSIGYDSAKVDAPASLDDLMQSSYRGKVALNGDPTSSGSGLAGVFMATLASGGTADDVAPGVEYFKKLNDAGNLIPVDVTPATIESGQTPVVLDWDYLERRRDRGAAELEGRRPGRRRGGRLLLPGDQRRRPAPERRTPVGGVPVLRRGPEPVAGRGRPPRPGRRHGRGRHHRHQAVRRAAAGHR